METAFLSYQLPQLPRAQKQARNSTQLLLQPHPVANKLPTALRIYLATLQTGITSSALHVYPVLGNRQDRCIPVAKSGITKTQRRLSTLGGVAIARPNTNVLNTRGLTNSLERLVFVNIPRCTALKY